MTKPPSNTTEVLKERETTHGDFVEVSRIDQAFKSILKSSPNWNNERFLLSDTQKTALEMIAHKITRIVCGDPNHRDHTDDISGYAELFHKSNNKKEG